MLFRKKQIKQYEISDKADSYRFLGSGALFQPRDGFHIFEDVSKFIDYNGKEIVYQSKVISDKNSDNPMHSHGGFTIVPGFKASEPYLAVLETINRSGTTPQIFYRKISPNEYIPKDKIRKVIDVEIIPESNRKAIKEFLSSKGLQRAVFWDASKIYQ